MQALTSDGYARESQTFLDIENVFHAVRRGQNHGFRDETIFMALYGADHGSLGGGRLVVVDDADTAKELE